MILQLSNGKCFYITTEQYLNLSDEDIRDITSCNIGSYISDPFKGSSINKDEKKKENLDFIYEEIDTSIDYNEDSYEIEITIRRNYITIDELDDIPDTNLEN